MTRAGYLLMGLLCASCQQSAAPAPRTAEVAGRPPAANSAPEATVGRSPAAGSARGEVTERSPGAASAAPVDEPPHEPLDGRVRLTPQVVRDAGLATVEVVARALPLTLSLTGQVVADPDRSALVAARVPGRIVEVRCKVGERVRKGSIVAVIESSALARARAQHAVAVAKARAARLNAERLVATAQKGLASGQEVAAAQAEAEALLAERIAAKAALDAFGASEGVGGRVALRASQSGFVLERDAVRGQTVTAEHIVVAIADLDRAYFTARLFEKDLSRVRVGAHAEVQLNAYPNERFVGEVETIGQKLDPAARTVLARIAVQNQRDRLKIGLFGSALVVVQDGGPPRTARPVVPRSAVTEVAGRDVVFVEMAEGDYELHPVTLGRGAAGQVEILSGLRVGERVVKEGVFTLKSAVLKSTFGEEE